MPAATIATGLFTSAAAGILAALFLLPFAELRRFFFAFNAGIALAFLALAQPLRRASVPDLAGGPDAPAGPADMLALAGIALCVLYIAALYLPARSPRRGLLAGASLAAAAATAVEGWATARSGQPAWIHAAGALAAAALLGAVIVAMILGHWYLVRSRLSEVHLVRFARLLGGTIGIRVALIAAGLLVVGAASPAGLAGHLHEVAVDRGFFFWSRIGLGLVGPAVFAWMVHETARIRSTQSATGILYIGVIFVLMGEFLGRYLAVAGSGPM